METIILDKINNPNVEYVIFYIEGCPYCNKARQLLKQSGKTYKGYNIDKIGMSDLLSVLNKNNKQLNFDRNHTTKPIIFYKAKFLGGARELEAQLS